ncbi:uncharacterized protein IL334_003028 [Kwoniella shivajii]|uniref:Major facilitator superfamily (MFS) profile domain-containing protein n=1 Tax=Kwoniella shivajii TaxID=564305 RepID=A0ABZ1CWR1_9TREE|nr:hypothetical protein IL334_003028 [Kwoniella shivajii]
MSNNFDKADVVSTDIVPVEGYAEEKNGPHEFDDLYVDPVEDSKLTRTLDLRILPLATAMYFFSSLDRSNYSNAKTDGMTTDLHFPTDGYAIVLSIFYVFFSFCGIPAMILTRYFGAHRTLPLFMLGFGSMSMINAAAPNLASSIVIRTLLGVFESGFASSLIFYLTTFYKRDELARRIACFYSCLALAGAFSGLLAYGVFGIDNETLHGWQYLFLIEGGATVVAATASWFLLPKSAAEAKFLTPEQKVIARKRLLMDSTQEVDTQFNAKKFFSPLLETKFWLFALIAIGYGTASTVASNFLSIIIQRFKYSVVKTNLWTVAPNFFSAICLGVSCYLSDRFRCRSWYLLSALCMTCTGCIILACLPISAKVAGYFATFLIAGGAFTPSVLFHSWHQNNDVGLDSRGFRVAALTAFANTGGLVSANIFLTRFAPKYVIPLIITAVLEGMAITIVLSLRLHWGRLNKKRNSEQGVNWTSKDVPTEVLAAGPADPRFRYFL